METSERWPLRARVWKRESTQEWVLEIDGTLNDTNMTCRHTEPLTTPFEDVPGLPSLYGPRDISSAPKDGTRILVIDAELTPQPDTAAAEHQPAPVAVLQAVWKAGRDAAIERISGIENERNGDWYAAEIRGLEPPAEFATPTVIRQS